MVEELAWLTERNVRVIVTGYFLRGKRADCECSFWACFSFRTFEACWMNISSRIDDLLDERSEVSLGMNQYSRRAPH